MTGTKIFTTVVESDKPFSDAENEVMELLIQASNAFKRLPDQKKFAVADWDSNLHNMQRILGMRTLRRLYPDYFVIDPNTVI